jgi:DNA-binding transcriptional LysR family regulator
MDFVLRAAIAGAGIAALPPQLVHEPFRRKQLEVVLPGHHLRGADLHVVLPSSAFVPARVMLLRDHLVQQLGAAADAATQQCASRDSPAPETRKRLSSR